MSLPARAAIFAVAVFLGTPLSAQPTCTREIGSAAAKKLVNRCNQVSPATHPPCNANNPCTMIRGEIIRSEEYLARSDEHYIRSQRARFNAAIAKGDLAGIGAVLADNAQIVTGADSLVFSGRAGELKLWSEDLAAPSRGIYVRTPQRIHLSPVAPMAMETGHWRGVDTKSAKDWSSGDYVAKWRRIGGKWLIESETYMTTACGGSYCPKKR
jgi:ketosteroid isomerase-like protein